MGVAYEKYYTEYASAWRREEEKKRQWEER